jgi:beta-glucanase (GH16 family)
MPSHANHARHAAIVCSVLCGLAMAAPAGGHDPARRAAATKTTTGTLVALPPIVQPGRSTAAPPETSQLVATFRPARGGRPVVLQRDTRRGWRTVATGVQDRSGSAAFDVRPGVYRARVAATRRTTAAMTGRVATQPWTTTFEDTFAGSSLDGSVWNDQVRMHESVWAPRTCGRSDATARRVAGGVLHLGITPDPDLADRTCSYIHPTGSGTHGYFLYSQVATEHTRFFRHGIIAARIKVQRARGMHSAFWMLPRDREFVVGDPAGGTEIDIMEYFGERPSGRDSIGTFIHWYDADSELARLGDVFSRARRVLDRDERWWDEFHVFSVEWTPQEYVFRVDGREYYRESGAVSLADSYLVLSMQAVDYELRHLTREEYDDSAQVDWVRVYAATSAASRDRTASNRSRLGASARR